MMKKILTTLALLGLTFSVQAKKQTMKEPVYAGISSPISKEAETKDLQEQLRFAVSEDAVNWYALNGNRPL